MPRQNVAPKLPTLPRGDQIAAYSTYLEAQKAVEALSAAGFPVQHVTIVGTDLKMVERVTGRLTYSRVAAAGVASGAWFGLFVGLLLSLFGGTGTALPLFVAIGIGAGFGLLFSVLSYSLTRGKRDFTSASQIVAMSYALLCDSDRAGEAGRILREKNLQGTAAVLQQPVGYSAPVQAGTPAPYVAPGQPAATPPSGPPAGPTPPAPTGEPKYGVRVVDGKPQYPTQPPTP
ncbi:hypothetical protein SAMN05216410_1732 [Sanguibacter gelidistatuariae]|uniref:General stress protein 17M-like domain-containing protein n=2 Tax=Sanguibacter gelidistatuariae TaxID=1814289 RepID=A0A1G6KZR8_9MICO|nr:hypothetical protein SAMN05216410_1732 [Sanguibacter gelidistatuariae]